MAKFALVRGGAVVGFRELESADDLTHKLDKKGDGGPFVRPVIDPGKPEINPLIETLETSQKVTPKAVEIVYTVTPRDLDGVKAELCRRVDRDAERERLKHITPGDGQALEYAYAVSEALAFQSGQAGEYPLLQASVTAGEANSISDAAALVMNKNQSWRLIGAKIREKRLSTKRSIDTSTDAAEAFSVYSAVTWGK